MQPMERLKTYVGFNDESAHALSLLRPKIDPSLKPIVDHFYAAIMADDGAAKLLRSKAQTERLKNTLSAWIIELLEGPHDEAYFQKREHIGRMHVEIGMPQIYMFTAMNLLRADLMACADEALSAADAKACVLALNKIIDLELAIMLGTYMEEHERREMEDFRELVMSHIPVTVFFLDEEMRVMTDTFCHPRLCQTATITGRPIAEVLHPSLLKASDLLSRVRESTAAGTEIVLPRVDAVVGGERVTVRVTVLHLDHPLATSLLYFEDLTDAVRSEARQKQAEHLAQLGTMAATVAHEIRNPLAGISSTIQVVSTAFAEDDPKRIALEKVHSQTMRLGDLVGDLLNFARPVSAHICPLDLRPTVEQAVADADAAAAPPRTKTRIVGEGRGLADAGLLGQVVLNLVLNAWQAEALAVTVQIAAGKIEVIDDGPGVPAAQHEKIFEAFVTTKTRGTGLGLPLTARAMEAMEGSVRLTSEEGVGSTFTLLLPVEV